MAKKARKVTDKELVRTLFSRHVRKALKKLVSATRAKARAKGGRKKR
jgi:hypothetical protein